MKKKTSATIRNADPRLVELLGMFNYKNFEVREHSSGDAMLYIRLHRKSPTVCVTVA